MNFAVALRLTMARYNIKNKDLAQKAGLREGSVSELANGKNSKIETVYKIFDAFSEEEKRFFLGQIEGQYA